MTSEIVGMFPALVAGSLRIYPACSFGRKFYFVEMLVMNCPKCGKGMQPGFLQGESLLAFNKTRHKMSLNPKDKEDVICKKMSSAADFHGFIYKECGLVVFDYKDAIARL